MATIYFTLDEVLAIHAHQVATYGGALGIRDRALLESALAMPLAGFAGELLHPTIDEQAAAYLFHLVKNHPFVDGNKRVGLACCLAFLRLNGRSLEASDDELVELVLGVADGSVSKAQLTVLVCGRSHQDPKTRAGSPGKSARKPTKRRARTRT